VTSEWHLKAQYARLRLYWTWRRVKPSRVESWLYRRMCEHYKAFIPDALFSSWDWYAYNNHPYTFLFLGTFTICCTDDDYILFIYLFIYHRIDVSTK